MDTWLVETRDTDPNERNYHNIVNRTGERLYPGRGLPRVELDFEKMKEKQEGEEERLKRP